MTNRFLTVLMFLACPVLLTAQINADISGVWTGTLYQNEGGIADRFELFFDIEQIGPAVKGKAYVQLGDLYAEMHLSGYRNGAGSWRISETEILRSDKAGLQVSWCMKEYDLRLDYREGELVLNGPWWGNSEYGPCVPGSITLKRKPKVALLFFGGQDPVNVEPHGHVHYRNHPFNRCLAIGCNEHTITGVGITG